MARCSFCAANGLDGPALPGQLFCASHLQQQVTSLTGNTGMASENMHTSATGLSQGGNFMAGDGWQVGMGLAEPPSEVTSMDTGSAQASFTANSNAHATSPSPGDQRQESTGLTQGVAGMAVSAGGTFQSTAFTIDPRSTIQPNH